MGKASSGLQCRLLVPSLGRERVREVSGVSVTRALANPAHEDCSLVTNYLPEAPSDAITLGAGISTCELKQGTQTCSPCVRIRMPAYELGWQGRSPAHNSREAISSTVRQCRAQAWGQTT